MQQQQRDLHVPMMTPYPQHIYYSPAYVSPASPYFPLSSAAAAHEQPASSVSALRSVQPESPDNCCDICCPGCTVCWPACGSCQSCDPSCVECCAACPGCSPGGCCSSSGCSPTRCSGWVGAWSVSLAMQWLAFTLLLSAIIVPEWFVYSGWSWQVGQSIGLWRTCMYDRWSRPTCGSLSYRTLLDVSDIDLFQTLRAFAVLSLVCTVVSAVLASVRMARHQRQRAISNRFELSLLAAGALSLVCLLVALITSVRAWHGFHPPYGGSGTPAAGFALLNTALALMLLALPIHAVTLLLHKRAARAATTNGENAEKTGVPLVEPSHLAEGEEAAAIAVQPVVPASAPLAPSAYTSSFQHPAPHYPASQYLPNHSLMSAGYPAPVVLAQPVPPAMAPQW